MPDPGSASALLLDIEGTTTPIDFVHRTLFPYARRRMESFLQMHQTDEAIWADLSRLEEEYDLEERSDPSLPPWSDEVFLASATRYLLWLMERDRKSTALKSLQGKIWRQGYEMGEIQGQVYEDVPPFLKEQRSGGGRIYIFSSGSVLAQQILFRFSNYGDLTPLLDGYFDTTTGPKREAASYTAIATAIDLPPSSILFVSDVAEELAAASTAGMRVALSIRPGNAPVSTDAYPSITTFEHLIRLIQPEPATL